MNKQTRETMQTAGVAFSFAYALIPQVRKFVNEQTESIFGGSSSSDDAEDSTSDSSDSTSGA